VLMSDEDVRMDGPTGPVVSSCFLLSAIIDIINNKNNK
jgi:hypothetical protein